MKLLHLFLILACAAPRAYCADKAVYGDDNRRDYWQIERKYRELADSVVSIWHDSGMDLSADGRGYLLKNQTLAGEGSVYCPDIKFAGQKTGALCSGSLVGEDLVLTAGHCVIDLPEYGCAHMKIAFGYDSRPDGSTPDELPARDVYSCREVVARYVDSESEAAAPKGGDYALIRLDREVTGRRPLRLRRSGEISTGAPLFVMGHPLGLPFKMADRASVRNTDQKDGYFMADLDAFKGNSGSPVFNAVTGRIEGVLTAGDVDFDFRENGGCFYYHVNPQDGGRGEDVARISLVRDLISAARRGGAWPAVKDMPGPGPGLAAPDAGLADLPGGRRLSALDEDFSPVRLK